MATTIFSILYCRSHMSTVWCCDLKPSHGGVEIELWWLWMGGHESWHRTVDRPGITTKTLEPNAKCSFSSFTHNTLFGHHPQPVLCVCLHNPRCRFIFHIILCFRLNWQWEAVFVQPRHHTRIIGRGDLPMLRWYAAVCLSACVCVCICPYITLLFSFINYLCESCLTQQGLL